MCRMKTSLVRIAVLSALSAMAVAIPAHAALVTVKYTVVSDYTTAIGYYGTNPSWTTSVTLTYDPTMAAYNGTVDAFTSSLPDPQFNPATVEFSVIEPGTPGYSYSDTVVTIGGSDHGALTVQLGANDFLIRFAVNSLGMSIAAANPLELDSAYTQISGPPGFLGTSSVVVTSAAVIPSPLCRRAPFPSPPHGPCSSVASA
jgi:hypothetical protein